MYHFCKCYHYASFHFTVVTFTFLQSPIHTHTNINTVSGIAFSRCIISVCIICASIIITHKFFITTFSHIHTNTHTHTSIQPFLFLYNNCIYNFCKYYHCSSLKPYTLIHASLYSLPQFLSSYYMNSVCIVPILHHITSLQTPTDTHAVPHRLAASLKSENNSSART